MSTFAELKEAILPPTNGMNKAQLEMVKKLGVDPMYFSMRSATVAAPKGYPLSLFMNNVQHETTFYRKIFDDNKIILSNEGELFYSYPGVMFAKTRLKVEDAIIIIAKDERLSLYKNKG